MGHSDESAILRGRLEAMEEARNSWRYLAIWARDVVKHCGKGELASEPFEIAIRLDDATKEGE
jgi:hypothetical protein